METYDCIADLPAPSASVLTMGTFDGMHLGHAAILERVCESAVQKHLPSAVLTFNPHPQHIIDGPDEPKKELLITLGRKLELLEESGVDLVFVIPFDEAFSRISAEDFLEKIIIDHFQPAHIVVGYDHHFGHRRAGNAAFLDKNSQRLGYTLDVVDGITTSAGTISSTSIRSLLKTGQCDEAAKLLGRPYEIPGCVVSGDGRGQELQYPTANLNPQEPHLLIPLEGVYVVSADIAGQTVFGMGNIGYRPTFNGRTLIIESHFFNPPIDDLYHTDLVFRFHHRLRDERGFNSSHDLQQQLIEDEKLSKEWIVENQGGQLIHASIQ